MEQNANIYVAGHRGLVGSAIVRALHRHGYTNITTRTSAQLDLRNQWAVDAFFSITKPDYIILAAAKVGGIMANNTLRGQFLYENLMIQNNVIDCARRYGVKKLLFLGSSCIYPKLAPQPLKEEYLLTGPLEYTNEPYALAKIAGLKMCEAYRDQYGSNFISCMPTNMYGLEDNFHPEHSHVLPALIRRFYEHKRDGKAEIVIWGDGTPLREFMYSDDLAEACVYLMQHYNESGTINVGTGEEVSIGQLAAMVAEASGYKGKLVFDTTKPNGTPRKLLDVSRLHSLGFKHQMHLKEGIAKVYEHFAANYDKFTPKG